MNEMGMKVKIRISYYKDVITATEGISENGSRPEQIK